jgi:hypothetical protein
MLGAGSVAALGKSWSAKVADRPRWLSPYRDDEGRYGLAALDGNGRILSRNPLPDRAHGVVIAPDRHRAIVVARRPGAFAAVIDLATGRVRDVLSATPGRHFYGHGVFSRNGELLFTTENDYNGERGVIGMRSVRNEYRPVGEWSSHGIGPHELVLSADGNTLIIANGGILTHPDSGRSKLNLPTMSPSLVRLDAHTGELLMELRLPPHLHQLSIRHLAATPAGDVVFGMQNQGPLSNRLPLVGVWRTDGSHGLWQQDRVALSQGYIGSVAVDTSGKVAATTAPRDGQILFWSVETGRCLGHLTATDACGVAAAVMPGCFLITTGEGQLLTAAMSNDEMAVMASMQRIGIQWDNHVTTVA